MLHIIDRYVIGMVCYWNTKEMCLTKIHTNVFIISKNVLLGINWDRKEIYEGNSIYHSKDVEKADETFKMFIKEDWRRIILLVNSTSTIKEKIIFYVCNVLCSRIQYQRWIYEWIHEYILLLTFKQIIKF